MARIATTALFCVLWGWFLVVRVDPPVTALGYGLIVGSMILAEQAASYLWPRPTIQRWTNRELRRFVIVDAVQRAVAISVGVQLAQRLDDGTWSHVLGFVTSFLVVLAVAFFDRDRLRKQRDEARRIALEVFE